MGAGRAVLKFDRARAGLRNDLLVFVYSHTKTDQQPHVVLLIEML